MLTVGFRHSSSSLDSSDLCDSSDCFKPPLNQGNFVGKLADKPS